MKRIISGAIAVFTLTGLTSAFAHHQPPCNHESIEEALERDKAKHS